MKWLLIALVALVLLAAVGAVGYAIGDHQPATTPKDTLTGVYVNGKPHQPHYYVEVRETSGGHVTGTINFRYEDGQSSVVMSFTGTTQDDVATLNPTVVTDSTNTTRTTMVPSLLSMTWGHNGIELGECTSYLQFTRSESTCSFELAGGKVRP